MLGMGTEKASLIKLELRYVFVHDCAPAGEDNLRGNMQRQKTKRTIRITCWDN